MYFLSLKVIRISLTQDIWFLFGLLQCPAFFVDDSLAFISNINFFPSLKKICFLGIWWTFMLVFHFHHQFKSLSLAKKSKTKLVILNKAAFLPVSLPVPLVRFSWVHKCRISQVSSTLAPLINQPVVWCQKPLSTVPFITCHSYHFPVCPSVIMTLGGLLTLALFLSDFQLTPSFSFQFISIWHRIISVCLKFHAHNVPAQTSPLWSS